MTPVAPGVFWLCMPLPFALDHINLWVLEDGDGWTLVDTGIANDHTRDLWRALIEGPLAGRPVRRLICTHFHPDHMGLSGWLTEWLGVPLWAPLGEWAFGCQLQAMSDTAFTATSRALYARAGCTPDVLDLSDRRGNPYRTRTVPHPTTLRRLMDGQSVQIGGRDWTVVVGYGHAPEHAGLWCPEAGVLISGDQILPRISPNVSVWPTEPDGDPLAQFLDSLRRWSRVIDDPQVLVLPSHGLPFVGVHTRVRELLELHDARLTVTQTLCADTPRSAADLLPLLFRRRLDDHQLFFALGETLAHLHHLETRQAVRREPGADGVDRFVVPD
ncbi:MBL fold metallo-hydrolase [Roseospira marina]|uniref:MBL fold metallo-hydrolase n=1 Tax=Roseospira marina TaxID=140057 RepID=A0A5M6IJ39_9PROT|nr:MBL fold metallo-hydrolase [Roseospira marina]KAA5607638.1 MBL fold metallo-hydrolase [Roseospira marina]MBB4312162.1 glyoxylase-like metal-dependent hydrolase (beta-lactamase superfamily II) [Roseospira marina]MBB5085822.1 glyoxylase-like metal-dependent hydrolase (beta-lactamase superfamily II) [Roseospira marina]